MFPALFGAICDLDTLCCSRTAKLRNARAKVKMYSENTTLPSGPDHDKRAKALRAVNDLEFKLLEAKKRFTDKDKDEMSDVDGAFITFNNEESYLRCLSTFKRHDGWCVHCQCVCVCCGFL